ncbi:hypothetical protein G6F24_014791 [Rhizopus arrhizus]|nr:hypothetical protein G6F24_014791 [Rhizopus arrhizus]
MHHGQGSFHDECLGACPRAGRRDIAGAGVGRPGGGAKRVSAVAGGSRRRCRRVGHQRPGRARPRAGARSQADRAGRRGAGRYLPLPVGLGQEARGHRGRRPLVAGGRRFRVDHASAHRAIGQGLAVRPGCGQS